MMPDIGGFYRRTTPWRLQISIRRSMGVFAGVPTNADDRRGLEQAVENRLFDRFACRLKERREDFVA